MVNFTKLQASGNDFILIEASGSQQDWPRLASAMCDRHFGIGADGLLLLSSSDTADFQMRVFNPDGSETEACGNGLRCLAECVVNKGLPAGKDDEAGEISVETIAGIRRIRLKRGGNKSAGIQVAMGLPGFKPEDIPITAGEGIVDIKPLLNCHIIVNDTELSLDLVSMGNPHAVCFGQYPVADFPLSRLGLEVERHKIFPNRTNFEVARVMSWQQIEARVWERGVGETMACGSGACAVAVAARRHGYVDRKVDIKLPGGVLGVEWDGAGEVFLSGSARIVFTGQWYPGEGTRRQD